MLEMSVARRTLLAHSRRSESAFVFSIKEQLLRRNMYRFRGGLVFKAHRLVYHSTLGLRVIKKKMNLLSCEMSFMQFRES